MVLYMTTQKALGPQTLQPSINEGFLFSTTLLRLYIPVACVLVGVSGVQGWPAVRDGRETSGSGSSAWGAESNPSAPVLPGVGLSPERSGAGVHQSQGTLRLIKPSWTVWLTISLHVSHHLPPPHWLAVAHTQTHTYTPTLSLADHWGDQGSLGCHLVLNCIPLRGCVQKHHLFSFEVLKVCAYNHGNGVNILYSLCNF